MTTPSTTSNNKAALRASLKKEDESLAERLVATDIPLVPPAEPESPEAAAAAAGTVVAPASRTTSKAATSTARPAKAAAVKQPAAAKAAAPATTAKSAKKAAPVKAGATTAAKAKLPGKGVSSATKPATSGKAARSQSRVVSAPAVAKTEGGKKAGKLEEVVGKLEKSAREKGDKLVRHSVELLKSEAAAIEGLRAELAKAAGWAASKSDILRAGVRLFAEQKVEQMKDLLASLAAASGGKKKA